MSMKKSKTLSLMAKLEKVANEMLDQLDTMEPQRLLSRQNVVKTVTELLALKNKLNLDSESGSMFKEEGDE